MRTNIGVLGSKNAKEKNLLIAEEVGSEIAKAGAVLICGGRGGIMRAAAKGCKESGGLSIGILPCLEKDECDTDYLDVALPTSMGYGRNIIIASAADVLIAVDGNYGTMSEVAFALNYGRKVIVIKGTGGTADYLIDGPFDVTVAEDAKDAVKKALELSK
jgi:hypothetical protein